MTEVLKSFKSLGGNTRPELLCPAGDKLALRAAVANGADAVYLGLKEFNARRSASNFSLEELKEAVDYAHLGQLQVYLTFNVLVGEAELEKAAEALIESYNAGIDGLIIQDWGVYELARKLTPDLPLHASTQMNVHNSTHAQFLEQKGFKRLILARELSLTEIASIRQNTSLQLEVFIHGARCFSYSGQCLFSSMVGERSGNRGLCTQPCRLQYELLSIDGEPRKVETEGQFILSTKDLCAIKLIPQLMAAGVDSFKIEGRLKSPEYVAIVTRVYRQAIDRFLTDPEHFLVSEEELDHLKEAFNRGFTEGFFTGDSGSDLMSYRQPNHRGLLLGRVSSVDLYGGKVTVLLQRDLHVNDELEFWVSRGGRVTQKIKIIWVGGQDVQEAKKGEKATLLVAEKRHLIKPGDRVFRVLNHHLIQKARYSLKPGQFYRKIPLAINAKVRMGKKATVEVRAESGEKAMAKSDRVVEKGRKRKLSESQLKLQLGRLGNTPYQAKKWDVDLEKGASVAAAVLNEIRRKLVAELNEIRLKEAGRKLLTSKKTVFDLLPARQSKEIPVSMQLAVSLSTVEQAKEAVRAGADWIYFRLDQFCPVKDKDRLNSILEVSKLCHEHGCQFGLATSNILPDADFEVVLKAVSRIKEALDAVVVDNIGLAYALEGECPLILDYHLNLFDPMALAVFEQFHPLRLTLSPELNQEQIKSIAARSSVPVEVLAHGSLEVLTARHCIPLVATEGCQHSCDRGKWAVKDAKGYVFPLELDIHCRSHLFNSKELCLFNELPLLKEMKVGAVRLMLERYPANEVGAISRIYHEGIRAVESKDGKGQAVLEEASEVSRSFAGYTRGHFFRGVR